MSRQSQTDTRGCHRGWNVPMTTQPRASHGTVEKVPRRDRLRTGLGRKARCAPDVMLHAIVPSRTMNMPSIARPIPAESSMQSLSWAWPDLASHSRMSNQYTVTAIKCPIQPRTH